jgi:hypothetical protein
MDPETCAILDARIVNMTRKNYNTSNTRLICWLFDKEVQYPGVIKPNLMATLVVAAEEDSNSLTERGRPSKARTSVVKTKPSILPFVC